MDNKENKTSYYSIGGIEVKDIWKSKLSKEEYKGLLKGNAIKYILRAGHKSTETELKDYKKCLDYVKWLIEVTEEDSSDVMGGKNGQNL